MSRSVLSGVPWAATAFERRLWDQGCSAVAGVDEAGRGSLLGSVVAAAVVIDPGTRINGVRDSKALSEARREALFDVIVASAQAFGIGVVSAEIIDRVNIKEAARLAMKLAVEDLGLRPDHVLVDAELIPVDMPQTSIVRGDALCHSIAAASILAKVTRDRMCRAWHEEYPQYGVISNKGYGTREHVLALSRYGPCPLHRKSFLRKILARSSNACLDLGI